MFRAFQSKHLILQKGKLRLREELGLPKSDIQAGRVHYQWTTKFQFFTGWSEQLVILGLQCLISKLGMVRTVSTRQGCTEVETTHVMGFTQGQAHSKCSINLSYYVTCYFHGHVSCLSSPHVVGLLVHQERVGPYPPGLSSVRSATAAREGASPRTSLSQL